jgi:hypothetical protein
MGLPRLGKVDGFQGGDPAACVGVEPPGRVGQGILIRVKRSLPHPPIAVQDTLKSSAGGCSRNKGCCRMVPRRSPGGCRSGSRSSRSARSGCGKMAKSPTSMVRASTPSTGWSGAAVSTMGVEMATFHRSVVRLLKTADRCVVVITSGSSASGIQIAVFGAPVKIGAPAEVATHRSGCDALRVGVGDHRSRGD